VKLTIDLAALRVARQPSAMSVATPVPTWSDDGEVAVLCHVEPAHRADGAQTRAALISRAWLDAYRIRPGAWPDLAGVEAAGVIVDLRRAEVFAAVDRMGLQTLYWSRDGDGLRIASRAVDALPAPAGRPELDSTALYCYVYFHHVPSPLSVFRGVAKLPRAHVLHCRGGDVNVARYRLETFREHADADLEELSRELLEGLRAAVSRSMSGETAIGAFLSGGLDSSTVAGLMAGRLAPEPGHSFSIGFDAAGYDEMEYARIAVRHFGLVGHEHYLTPEDVLASTPGLLRGTDEPFGNSSIAAAYQCALLARDAGITHMLAGDGGDELFAGNARYAKQLLFERYLKLPAPLRRGLLEPVIGPLGRALPSTVLGKAARYIEQANVTLPDRLQSYNYLHRHAASEVFTGPFLDSVDAALPLQLWRQEFATPDHGDAVDRMLFLDWAFTLHDNDLVKVNTACRAAGMSVAFPMLDHALVDLSCRLPGSLKMRGEELRWFYKHATRELLPPEITAKTKHGFGLPFGVWTRTHPGLRRLSEQAFESLSGRGIFRDAFLRETLRLHREGHAVYYGELVWVLMALELWLEANAVSHAD
jgi:asparagine synthase (glutamine-hydrolysing)